MNSVTKLKNTKLILKRLKLYKAIGIERGLGLDEIEIDFSRFKPGLILLKGKSGSGKSTILNNLHPFRVVGVSTKIIQDDFKNHFYKDGFRELEFEFKDNHYLSQIYVEKAFLFKNDKLLNETGKVSEYDKMTFQEFGDTATFFKLLYAGKTFDNILNLTKGERKELIVDYLLEHLKQYEVYQKDLKVEQDELVKKVERLNVKIEEKNELIKRQEYLESEIVKVNDYLYELTCNLADENQLQKLWEGQCEDNKEIETKLNELKVTKAELYQKVENAKSNFENLERELEKVHKEYADKKGKIKDCMSPESLPIDLDEKLVELNKNIKELKTEKNNAYEEYINVKNSAKYHAEKIETKKKEIAKLKEKTLPCDSSLQVKCSLTNSKDISGMVSEKETELQKLVSEEFLPKEFYDKWSEDIKKDEVRIEVIYEYKSNSNLIDRVEELKGLGKTLSLKHESSEKDLEVMKDAYKDLIDMKNDYESKIKNQYSDRSSKINDINNKLTSHNTTIDLYQKEIETIKTKISSLTNFEKEITELNDKIDNYNLLIQFFGKTGGMLYELEESGDQISIIANKLCENYKNKTIRIKFDTLKENSKGEIKEVFDIKVSIDGADWGTYCSDGEEVLVSNAIIEGMSYLQADKSFKTRMVNESDGSIDSEARIGFIKLLEQGNELNDRMFTILISHSEEVKGYIQQSIELSETLIINY